MGAVVLKFNTSIIQAKKFILVVKRLLCFLRSLSDSLMPIVEILLLFLFPTFINLIPTLCSSCMLLPKSKDGPIQARHNEDKGEVDNVWEETSWKPERSLKFNPMKLNRRVEVRQVVSEREEPDISKGPSDRQIT